MLSNFAVQRNITLINGVSMGKLVETSNSTTPMSDFAYETHPRTHTPTGLPFSRTRMG